MKAVILQEPENFTLGDVAEPDKPGVGDALVRVHMWLGIAAVREKDGCVNVAAPLRDVVAQSMTIEQVSAAEARTLTWLADHKITDINLASAGTPGC